MSEEIKKQETMDDFAQEIEASFSNFRDADMEIWDKLEQMKEDKEAFEVTIEGIVKGGAIAYVEGIRAFIPVSKLSLEYVKEPEEFLKSITAYGLAFSLQSSLTVLSSSMAILG